VDEKVLGEPNQMAIALQDTIGIPSVRMTLVKGYDKPGRSFEIDNKMPYLDKKPLLCFRVLQEAIDKKVYEEPNQMAIASADANGVPSVRMVLLKGYDERGFMFYTNYESRKAQELANGHAALCMYWEPLQRSVSSSSIATSWNRWHGNSDP